MVFLQLFFVFLLVIIAYQDFKQRAISLWTIPALLVTVFAISTLQWPIRYYVHSTLINLVILLLNFAVVSIYFAVKNKNFQSIVNSQIGIGDILFIIVLAFLFSPVELIIFLTGSFIFILFTYIIVNFLNKDIRKEIPLAGGLSSILAILWVYKMVFNANAQSILPFNINPW